MADKTDRCSPEEQDNFWDIEKLLPHNKVPSVRHKPSFSTETTEIILPPKSENAPSAKDVPISRMEDARLSNEKSVVPTPPAPTEVYRPEHLLIREVRIFPWRSGFRFYERFCEMAERFFDRKGEMCDRVAFFSYMPQYDQMSRAQLSWYFYWRYRVRAGEYLKTDYSYIFLLLFEIINLPEKIPPLQGQNMMCALWRNYRKEYPLLNRYLADWICDYSLIHHLTPPVQALGDLFGVLAQQATLREFYAVSVGENDCLSARAYVWFCSNYDYRKSKAYLENEQRRAMFDRHIPRAIAYVLKGSEQRGQPFTTAQMQCITASRDAYVGALCSFRAKRRIEIDYCSFTRSHELRFLVTDMVKYAENKLRAVFGVKSRLNVHGLPDGIREIMDAYFSEQFPHRLYAKRADIAEERPAYERLYDLPQEELSMSRASMIEAQSWDTTQRLVEAFSEEDDANVSPGEEPSATPDADDGEPVLISSEKAAEETGNEPGKWTPYEEFLRCALKGDRTGQRDFARSRGELPDAIADRINELAADTFGDILLEADEQGFYTVLPEYRDEAMSLLPPT